MAKLIVDFEWPVAKRYSFKPPYERRADHTLAAGGERFGYLIASGPRIMTRPLDGQGAFLKILLSGGPLHEIAVKAAATYGMLTCQSGEGESEPVWLWKQLIGELKELQKLETSGAAPYGLSLGARLDVLLVPAKGRDGPRLAFRPVHLRDAIMIFWATTIATGGTLRPCKQCGEFFEAGGESDRRADAQFCCDTCRHRFNNALKRAYVSE
jgi:hypothetical protein